MALGNTEVIKGVGKIVIMGIITVIALGKTVIMGGLIMPTMDIPSMVLVTITLIRLTTQITGILLIPIMDMTISMVSVNTTILILLIGSMSVKETLTHLRSDIIIQGTMSEFF